MKNKKKMTILVMQLFALIIFVISYKSYTDSVIKPVQVYKYSRTILEGTKIEEKDLILTEVAINTYSSNMIVASDISSVIGKYTTTKVYQDTLCYAAHFGDLDNSNSMFTTLDLTNARLLALTVNMSDVAAFLEPGDKIDLMFTANGEATIINMNGTSIEESSESGESASESAEESSESFVYTKTFLQEVIVYDVLNGDGFKYVNRADRYPGQLTTKIDGVDTTLVDNGQMAYLLLIVSPEEAEEIKTREATGDITVVKRFDESETHETLGYIIGNYGKVFAGNANAETSSLQIISTIQDTDNDDDVMSGDDFLTNSGVNNSNGGSLSNSGSTDSENLGVVGNESIE